MAIVTALFNTEEYESCILCSSKHDRTRPSLCQCKHCSIPLCFDCMKEHHDELLQNIAKASHQYNELQDLFQKKQKMIVEETTKFVENVNQYFETYINELRQTQQKIIAATENTRQNAQVKNRIPMVGLISFYFFRILYRKLVLVYKRLVSLFRP